MDWLTALAVSVSSRPRVYVPTGSIKPSLIFNRIVFFFSLNFKEADPNQGDLSQSDILLVFNGMISLDKLIQQEQFYRTFLMAVSRP